MIVHFPMLNKDVEREIMSYLTVPERYGVTTIKSVMKFTRQHACRVTKHQPVIPYYSNIRHTRNMPGLRRYGSSPMEFYYWRSGHRFQFTLAIFRDYRSYHKDHIDYHWVVGVQHKWKKDIEKALLDKMFLACTLFQSEKKVDMTCIQMCDRIEIILGLNSDNNNGQTGYFIPKDSPIVTHQRRLETVYQIIQSLSVFLNT